MNQELIDKLITQAREIKVNSYSPYSNFRVGAAILMDDGEIITGVNIENVSFGATNCAERGAIFTAIGSGYKPKSIKAVAVSGDTEDFLPPCSICRQVFVELCEPSTPVYLTRQDGGIMEISVSELVPMAFDSLDI